MKRKLGASRTLEASAVAPQQSASTTPSPITTEAPPAIETHSPSIPAWKRPFTALEERDFRNLWVGMLPGTLAMQMGMVTTGWVAYDISESATSVGFVSLGSGIPMLTLGLFGGVVADRFPKRRTLLMTQSLIGTAAAICAVLVLTGIVEIWHLMAISAMQGVGFAFNMPSRQAFVAQLISRERLMNAIALNNAGMNFARVIGPTLAGLFIAVIGPGEVYVVMALMYAFVVYSLTRIPQSGAPVGNHRPPPLKSLADGLGYVRSNGVVFTLLVLAFAPVLLGMPYQQLMPVFAEDVFGVGASGLGLLLSFNGIGALVGSLGIAGISNGFRRRGLLQMATGITFGIAVAVFALSQSYPIALITLLFAGAASAAFQSLNSTLVMTNSDPAYHGRVMSVYMLTFSAMPLGVVPFGALSDIYGAPITIGIGGILLTCVIAMVGLLHPSYRHIR
ncbi:MAG TPA: MFS transporter [Thermomicrobiales bacterium]|nr:MFS transporter [Thermomicrobiales bacterium]